MVCVATAGCRCCASRLFRRASPALVSHDCATNTASRPNRTANPIITKVLERTIAISSKPPNGFSSAANIESVEVLNWCNAAGFSIYAEEGLKRYCLWCVTRLVQHRGNLYRDSRLANQLETIALRR